MERDGFRYENGRFLSDSLDSALANVPSLVRLTDDSIKEHLEKASIKIANADSAGAITNAYTLVEEFLKQILPHDRDAVQGHRRRHPGALQARCRGAEPRPRRRIA